MGTTVIYNGVTLQNVSTNQWNETIMYDDSGADPVGMQYDLVFDSVVHVQGIFDEGALTLTAPAYATDAVDHASATAALRSILTHLEQPRKRLIVKFGENTIVNVAPADGRETYARATDIDNGPKPQSVKIFRIASDQAFRIRFAIRAFVNNCEHKFKVGMVVNNRWSVQEAMDENFAIHRTITGTIRLNAAPTANTLDPLGYRNLAFPQLEDGFRRQSVSYTASSNGLQLNYQVVDQQSHYAAPWPATRMTGSHTEQTMDGATFISSCTCRLTGPPHCSVPDLVARAIQFTQYRINWDRFRLALVAGDTPTDEQLNVRILDAYIREDVGDTPAVEVGVRIQQTLKEFTSILAKVRNEKWGQAEFDQLRHPLTSNDDGAGSQSYRVNWHYNPSVFGYDSRGQRRTALSSAFLRCVLQGQCGDANVLQSTSGSVPDKESESKRREVTITETQSSSSELDYPNAAATWSDEHLNAMYLVVSQSNVYTWDNVTAQLPVAGPIDGNAPTASLVKLSEQTSQRILKVDYERFGIPPRIPWIRDEKAEKVNMKCVGGKVEILTPKLSEDGSGVIHRAIGRYLYYCDRQIDEFQDVPVGRLPTISPDHVGSLVELDLLFTPYPEQTQ